MHAWAVSFVALSYLLLSGDILLGHRPVFYFIILLADKVIGNFLYSIKHVILPRGPYVRHRLVT
jgi:hypothetical protein